MKPEPEIYMSMMKRRIRKRNRNFLKPEPEIYMSMMKRRRRKSTGSIWTEKRSTSQKHNENEMKKNYIILAAVSLV